MDTKTYYFIISMPKHEMLEHTTRLNSYIRHFFPDKKNPYILKPLEIREYDTLAKISIETTEDEITKFADSFFQNNYELIEHSSGDIEIAQKNAPNTPDADDPGVRH